MQKKLALRAEDADQEVKDLQKVMVRCFLHLKTTHIRPPWTYCLICHVVLK